MCRNLTKILSVYLREPLTHFLSSCYLFIVYFWSFWVFVAVCRLSLVSVSGSYSSSLQYMDFSLWVFSCCGAWTLGSRASEVVVHWIRCPTVCGILVPRPGIKPVSSTLKGRFLTTGPSRKSPISFSFSLSLAHGAGALGVGSPLADSDPPPEVFSVQG